jgi:hypothetical protein
MGKIRQAEQHMRKTTGLERPFVHREVMTDGRDVWIVGDEQHQVEAASGPRGQQASRIAPAASLKSVQYTANVAATWIPAEHVLVSPHVQFGEPVVQGTRHVALQRGRTERLRVEPGSRPLERWHLCVFEARHLTN